MILEAIVSFKAAEWHNGLFRLELKRWRLLALRRNKLTKQVLKGFFFPIKQKYIFVKHYSLHFRSFLV